MPASRAKALSSLFRSAAKTTAAVATVKTIAAAAARKSKAAAFFRPSKDAAARRKNFETTAVAATAAKSSKTETSTPPSKDPSLTRYFSLLDTCSSSPCTSKTTEHKQKDDTPNTPARQLKGETQNSVNDVVLLSLTEGAASSIEDASKLITREISTILCLRGSEDVESVPSADSQEADVDKSTEKVLDLPWFSSRLRSGPSLQRKEVGRVRKQKWIFKNTQESRFGRLVRMCAETLGADAIIWMFGRLGRETGPKEYNAFISLCIETAKKTEDEEVLLEQTYKAYQLFKSMKEQGFPIEEETYGPFLMYLIDMQATEEFYFFLGIIRDENPSSNVRLGYYEMLLWIEVDNEEKIHELIHQITAGNSEGGSVLRENYLLALCERDRKKELLKLLENVDVTEASSDNLVSIFKSLGRLSLQSFAEKLILALKAGGHGAERISNFVYFYATSLTNLKVEDIVLKYEDMHAKLEVPSSLSLKKLIEFCCASHKVHIALDLVDRLCEAGFTLPTETFNSILHACEGSCEFNLVGRIYSILCCHNLMPDTETFRGMINLSVRMRDYDGAYNMLKDLEKTNVVPTAVLYNTIMAGYFREKNIVGALRVLKEMQERDVKPDYHTYSYLIGNAKSEEDIIKYCEEMKSTVVQFTKHVYMALINAYATLGDLKKAKEVVLDKGIPLKNLTEVKSALVAALASHGQMSDALEVYEEVKQSGCSLEPKAIISLIERMQPGEVDRVLQLIDELSDRSYWIDGCCRGILYCVRNKNLRSAVDLLKKLRDEFHGDELASEVVFDEAFSEIAEMEPPDLQIGLGLLEAIKEELKLHPSRKCLDFLLSICVNTKDSKSSLMIWEEYQNAGLPYNVLSFVRMYQVLLAAGDLKSAAKVLNRIPKDDSHVRLIISACQLTYNKSTKGDKSRKDKLSLADLI
ncbi:hypothetical protein Ancab_023516 [Ancistrocladus abbreviatus]